MTLSSSAVVIITEAGAEIAAAEAAHGAPLAGAMLARACVAAVLEARGQEALADLTPGEIERAAAAVAAALRRPQLAA